MKILHISIVLLLYLTKYYAQYTPNQYSKLCLNGDVSRIMNIHVTNKLVIAKIGYGERIEALDIETGQTIWSQKNANNSGYSICSYNDLFMYSCNVNTYEGKTAKVNTKEWLFIAQPETGKKLDSTLLNFSVIYLSPTYTPPIVPAIISGNDRKMKSVLFNAKTGEISHTFFTEHKEGNTSIVPSFIVSDKKCKWVATGTANGSKGIYIHDFNTGSLIKHFPGEGEVSGIVFSEDNALCVYFSGTVLTVVNTQNWTKIKEIKTNISSGHMDLHPDNKNVIITGFGTAANVTFIDINTGKSHKMELSFRGGRPFFTPNGKGVVIPGEGMNCKLSSTKNPYLAWVPLEGITIFNTSIPLGSTNNANSNLNAASVFEVGTRVYAKYSGKFYSATILSISNNDYTVIFDDNYVEVKKKSDLKFLTAMKIGDNIEYRSSNGSFVAVSVVDIKNEIVKIKHSNGSTEWVSVRNTMQVE